MIINSNSHLFQIHRLHRPFHPPHHPRHTPRNLSHRDRGLYSTGNRIDARAQPEEIHPLVLFPDRVLGVDLGDVGVVLLYCLEAESQRSKWRAKNRPLSKLAEKILCSNVISNPQTYFFQFILLGRFIFGSFGSLSV